MTEVMDNAGKQYRISQIADQHNGSRVDGIMKLPVEVLQKAVNIGKALVEAGVSYSNNNSREQISASKPSIQQGINRG